LAIISFWKASVLQRYWVFGLYPSSSDWG
jgi:hypothetical protein